MGELELVAPEVARVALKLLMLREELARLAVAEAVLKGRTRLFGSTQRREATLSLLPAEQNRSVGLSSLTKINVECLGSKCCERGTRDT